MIAFADISMISALKTLWQDCFGDGDIYVNFIFQKLLLPDNILVYTQEDGCPAAMLCVEYMDILGSDGSLFPGAYVYAVATSPAHRGRGLSTALMEQLHLYLAARGICCSVLVPAGESLFDFYKKRGYEYFSSIKKARVTAGEIPGARQQGVVVPMGLERMERMRDSYFLDSSLYVRWKTRYLGYISDECSLLGGEVLRYCGGGENGYAVCYRDGSGGVVIKELVAPPTVRDDLLRAIHARLRAGSYTIYLREDREMNFSNTVLPFSLVRWYDKKKKEKALARTGASSYITHVLD